LSSGFDSRAGGYREAVERSIAFSGAGHEVFTQIKARELLELCRRRVGDPGSLAFLDVGCGPGETDRALAGSVGSLAGADSSEAMARAAAELNPWAEYAHADATRRLPYDDATFDVSFTICVLHHVDPPDRPRFVAEMARVTRPGGVVAVFEHNPLNPLTRRAVAGCEFDRGVRLLGRRACASLLRDGGLAEPRTAYVVFFRSDSEIRQRIARRLRRIPLGAQYAVSARRP
jgi:SAM-dependent methyltransferase